MKKPDTSNLAKLEKGFWWSSRFSGACSIRNKGGIVLTVYPDGDVWVCGSMSEYPYRRYQIAMRNAGVDGFPKTFEGGVRWAKKEKPSYFEAKELI